MSGIEGGWEPVSLFCDLGVNAQAVIKATHGVVFSVHTDNNNAGGTRYMQLFDRATALTGGEVPKMCMAVGNNLDDLFDWIHGVHFNTGIVWGWSTTFGTYTAADGTKQITHIVFR